eukprot:TRINITY_DN27718_c1_g1_i1.p1 TRINITY_DN27718_c1_g1~~TRINITY_DN27718_c1_g1_i1.p1  ORF type:complete len:137 (-),score=15.99 TRINITY_DN27718_c1_g1_i1:43-453(-)
MCPGLGYITMSSRPLSVPCFTMSLQPEKYLGSASPKPCQLSCQWAAGFDDSKLLQIRCIASFVGLKWRDRNERLLAFWTAATTRHCISTSTLACSMTGETGDSFKIWDVAQLIQESSPADTVAKVQRTRVELDTDS